MGMLERHIQIGDNLGRGCHDLHQPVGDVTGVGVEQADPGDFGGFAGDLLHQQGKTVFEPEVMTVVRRILGDEDELFHPILLKQNSLAGDGFGRAADRSALNQRNGAEGAGAAAAVGNF